jgi:tRNA-binding protein
VFADFFLYQLGDAGIRVGRIIEVEPETRTHKPAYRMVIDFGKFGKRLSYGRFAKSG